MKKDSKTKKDGMMPEGHMMPEMHKKMGDQTSGMMPDKSKGKMQQPKGHDRSHRKGKY